MTSTEKFKVCTDCLASALCPLLLFTLVAPAAHAAESAAKYKAPRNEYGQPDLRGVWNFSSDVPLERSKEFADKEYRTPEDLEKANAARDKNFERMSQTAAVVGAHNTFWLDYRSHVQDLRTALITYPTNGRLPKLVEGVQKIGAFAAVFADVKGARPVRFFAGGIGKEGPEDRGLFERCIAGDIGPPITPGFDNNYIQIFQARDHVVLLAEHIHDARTIPLDARPPVDDPLRDWFGYSRGRWEGDTLQERYTPSGANMLMYEATITDSDVFTRPWKISMPLYRRMDKNVQLLDFECVEFVEELLYGKYRKRLAVR